MLWSLVPSPYTSKYEKQSFESLLQIHFVSHILQLDLSDVTANVADLLFWTQHSGNISLKGVTCTNLCRTEPLGGKQSSRVSPIQSIPPHVQSNWDRLHPLQDEWLKMNE